MVSRGPQAQHAEQVGIGIVVCARSGCMRRKGRHSAVLQWAALGLQWELRQRRRCRLPLLLQGGPLGLPWLLLLLLLASLCRARWLWRPGLASQRAAPAAVPAATLAPSFPLLGLLRRLLRASCQRQLHLGLLSAGFQRQLHLPLLLLLQAPMLLLVLPLPLPLVLPLCLVPLLQHAVVLRRGAGPAGRSHR